MYIHIVDGTYKIGLLMIFFAIPIIVIVSLVSYLFLVLNLPFNFPLTPSNHLLFTIPYSTKSESVYYNDCYS